MANNRIAVLVALKDSDDGLKRDPNSFSFKPASEALPLDLQKSPQKVSTTIRLSNDVVQAFHATGDGWQTRVDSALKDWLKTHSPA